MRSMDFWLTRLVLIVMVFPVLLCLSRHSAHMGFKMEDALQREPKL
jgi:hypothetical protein